MAPPTFMTQRKYIQLISLAKKLDACKNELLRYRRGENSAPAATVPSTPIAAGGVDHIGLLIAGQNNPTNMETRLPKRQRNMRGGKRNSLKSVASEPTLRTSRSIVTPQMGRKKRHSDPTPLTKAFPREKTQNQQKIRNKGELPRGKLAKGKALGQYKPKKKKKKKLQNTTQIFPHPKGTQKSRKKKKTFCTLPKIEDSRRITSVARCSKKCVLHKQEEETEYTFRSPHSGDDQMVPVQVQAKLDVMPLVHTSQMMERHSVIASILSNSPGKKSIPLSKQRRKQQLTKPSKSAETAGEEAHHGNTTNKRQDESAPRKGAPLSKGADISRRKLTSLSRCTPQSAKHTRPQLGPSRGSLQRGISPKRPRSTVGKTVTGTQSTTKRALPSRPSLRASPLRSVRRKRQNITRNTAPKRRLLCAPATQHPCHDHQDGEKQRANRKTVKEFIRALNRSSVIICTEGHRTRPKRGRRRCFPTGV
ncbi:hypothetical protein C922_04669 [Plasmodium inui San Antonio 1]|uniref:Uncharacterized protein n=1 Tax=Plasmodium inui San Antonio 1 TaxID=1237626 RepID=W6ZVX5_9APIC|nr:hypothetical protein C922_04669 [Plasmodium inui San Antonio 1]EUD64937.1 hypothetical protein C922_04669 [Plasmodium inui San Antonio 1]